MLSKIDFSVIDLSDPNDWLPMEALSELYPHIPFPTIRFFYHQRVRKGLAPVCKKFGKQILMNKKGFGHWMANYD